ncbi:MAG: PilC/PilY family type IV pilus protein [Burkholderiaceae bacterium]|nr:PilC/PilY family type IV pilus protein [Burkholderiaceae bacterium]
MKPSTFRQAVAAVLATLLAVAASPAQAATDLAQAPIGFLLASPVKPNVLFILDDSGSMQWSYLGDEVLDHRYENAVGYRSSLCNRIYYNPAVRYPAPLRSDGSPFPPAAFGAAAYDGFRSGSDTVDLGRSFMAWRSSHSQPPPPPGLTADCWTAFAACSPDPTGLPNLPEPAHYYVYTGDRPERLGDNSADDHCKDTVTHGANLARWTKVIVGERSGPNGSDERQNFANWFSFHRTRMLAMKTAVGRAFSQLDGSFRVGLSAISEPGASSWSPGFLRLGDFSGEHRRRFYDKLYATTPIGSTPLRAALAKAGRLYAGKLLTGTDDPVQYSCQRHYAILSTDGYWNTQAESAGYGPTQIDGRTDVGNADGRLPRPMADGSANPRPYRMATLTIGQRREDPSLPYSGTHGITVDGLQLLAGQAYIEHAAEADPVAEAGQLASIIAGRITLNGYRAYSERNQVHILAPASAGEIGSVPQIASESSMPLSAAAFGPVNGGPRSTNTLADVAAYYFETDLRSPALGNCGASGALCVNNVPAVPGQRGGPHQHMITHTLGLGATGTLRYRDDYETAADGDFRRLVDGTLDWPDPIFGPGRERIDDLWHAAVNGGGRYFSAGSPESLARALAGTMAAIRATTAAAAAAATSSQEPSTGDNLLFASRYRSLYWDGELEARRIDPVDGSLSPTIEWSAARQLAQRVGAVADSRTLWLPSRAAPNGLKEFRWSALDADERAHFSGLCPGQEARRFSHCAQLGDELQAQAGGERLLSFIRGHSGSEDRTEQPLRLFRKREQVLGAAVNAQPVFVGPPAFRYADDNYAEFRDRVAAKRPGIVYLAANDGMLHAFDAASGHEHWAFIPAGVLPQLWRSADPGFATGFRYLLDGTPVVGDVCPAAPARTCAASEWRTVLVAGLGAAGREYYALDITQPARPAFLWRFAVDDDSDLGHATVRPLIIKRRDGRWVVAISSGINNVNPGSGRGVLFVLDAATGQRLQRIDTGAGGSAAPAGLGQLNAWVDNLLDNTAERLYAGDLLGNLWRFDISDPRSAESEEAVLLARFVRNGIVQPVTTRPELSAARIGGALVSLVSVATGRWLGVSDAKDGSVQSLYTLKDTLTSSGLGDVRSLSSMVRQQLSAGEADGQRTVTRHPVDWSSAGGWYLDFDAQPGSGERVHIDIEQQLGLLRVVTNVPDADACRPRAQSWLYSFHHLDGSHVPQADQSMPGLRISRSAMIAGARQLRLGKRGVTLLTDDTGGIATVATPSAGGGPRPARRVSWRELDLQ